MITRRAFLIGAGSALTLSIVDKFVWHLENKGMPLIEAPAKPKNVLYVHADWDYELNLGEVPDRLPFMSWREFLFERLGNDEPKRLSDFRRIYEEWGVKPHQFDDELEGHIWEYYWTRCESPTANAYHLLDGWMLGQN